MQKRTCNVCGEAVYIPEIGEQVEGYETPMEHFEEHGHAWNQPEVRKCNSCGYLWAYGGSSERPTCPACRGKSTVPVDQ